MSTNKLRLIIVIVVLVMLSCSVFQPEQASTAPKHILETNAEFEMLWSSSDLHLSYNNRRPNMVGAPGRIILLGSISGDLPTGKLNGLDSLTGKTVWQYPGASLGEIIADGESLYRGTSGTATLISYDVKNGEVLWSTRLPQAQSTSEIYLAENKIFIHTNDFQWFVLDEDGGIIDSRSETNRTFLKISDVLYMEDVYAIKAIDYSSQKELWQLDLGASYTNSPIFDGDTIYLKTVGDTAFIYSINRHTGSVNWKMSEVVLSNLYLMGDKMYFINGDNKLTVLDKLSGNEILNAKISPSLDLNEPNGSYFVSGDSTNKILALYFGDNDQLVGLKIKSP